MVVYQRACVIVRSRLTARNLLIQAQGVDVRAATNAAQEAATLLEQAAQNSDAGDVSPHITGKPLVCGSVSLPNARWRVVYRMVGQLVVMVVVPPACNAFAALDVLEKAVRIVTAECKPTETNPDRLERRYPEVYMALGALLAGAGTLTSSAALREGRAVVDSVANMDKAAARSDKSDKGDKGAEALHATSVGVGAAAGGKGTKRTLADHAALLPGMMGFNTEAGLAGVKPLPGWELAHATPPAVPQLARHQFAVMPQASSGQDDHMGFTPEKKPAPAEDDDPFGFIKAPLAAKAEEAPKAPAAPTPVVPPAPLLRLSEVWEAEVVGASITRSRLRGSLQWVPELVSATVPAIPFCLSLSGAVPHSKGSPGGSEAARTALGRAHAHSTMRPFAWPAPATPPVPSSGVEPGTPGFVADVMSAKAQLAPMLLRYTVPAVQAPLPVPIQVKLGVSLQPAGSDALQTAVLLGVQLQFAPELDGACVEGVEVKLVVPALFELPSRASPPGASMDGAHRTLTWKQGAGEAGRSGGNAARAFSAVFLVSAGEAATKATLRGISAEVVATGARGATLTGVTLHQYGFDAAVCSASCSWAAKLTAKLPLGS
uniref:MHD domain-containing protein n=1 Tax=Chlamydomonas leiostraca TaxID=1034604 RepID=A0A7S0S610_9CHLO|mmetsp:Transcript_9238/g.22873  ORF Transcript_9238/g.22873 Transcript_9238/m.22873 type:complete len:602 (+) Transcript_9238:121-1926(+)|eukprot:CAMPEP_0202858550 /NCGR_PEP_ID=MMETSP1391-20130828/1032_1 /ASSEMBLY_ACC=CAM_ASM_000867 /TAXON_ID=1034604 /ORGANISM="Chlamydomonas leiostraca, Strain SAG 11-49" /LENGTH=601 /DNA_ID=CAMNT_0049537475 /DNA_START=116 /DNA_END=1921 /DNA_ORIENTATION=-